MEARASENPNFNKLLIFGLGILIGILLSYYFLHNTSTSPAASDITFEAKSFYDSGKTTGDGFMEITGQLSGEGIGYKNNSISISCYKDQAQCLTYEVDQIGINQVGDLVQPTSLQIVDWGPVIVTASSGDDGYSCSKTTINIDRSSQDVEWVQEPINQSKLQCKDSDNKTYKWTVVDPAMWAKLKAK